MSKPTGLSAFVRPGTSLGEPINPEPNRSTLPPARQRLRGKGESVALTVRLSRAQWTRVHQLALSEGVSIQSLAIEGLSKLFVEQGLPALKS
jgi:hypothetical protein